MQDDTLLILSCSEKKLSNQEKLPALFRYDGPFYRVLRAHLREHGWPSGVKIAVLSAEFGLIGALTPIEFYDRRMTPERAEELKGNVRATMEKWLRSERFRRLVFVGGKDYADLLQSWDCPAGDLVVSPGFIGQKLNFLSSFLRSYTNGTKRREEPEPRDRPLYFLPDWDDLLDPHFDFQEDGFSEKRRDVHVARFMNERGFPICDGILVSLAHGMKGKGVFRLFNPTDTRSLAPAPLRAHYGLGAGRFLFGDCGAFSYLEKEKPPLHPAQAAVLYEIYGVDLGASVDHIPAPFLPEEEKVRRMEITRENARLFLEYHRQLKCSFTPVGVIQGTAPASYARQLFDYVEMGYRHLAIGGLAFRPNSEIVSIAQELAKARQALGRKDIWLHLFGVSRPELLPCFQELGVQSFDNASYFRKAWLRSDQNYLGVNGEWYAAVRVPVLSDPRNYKKVKRHFSLEEAAAREKEALSALILYGEGKLELEETLEKVLAYDEMVDRADKKGKNYAAKYRRTLEERPWEECPCPVCRELGIHAVIFRGTNRNKRRGAHNTWMLYRKVIGSGRGESDRLGKL
ncbi:tRNA-guanine transglycosylase DpdA [Desulfothermobacter acidiphilus]|uniref:tRNA-guanine transglycosylase DpdA n=1 Tax=Desulfothermobacter acidiphilus TaxID=1938353 RepID=UPI003F8AEB3E